MRHVYAFDCEDRSYCYGDLEWYGTRSYVLAKTKREAVDKLHSRFLRMADNSTLDQRWLKENITKVNINKNTYRININDVDSELDNMKKDIFHIKAEMAKLEAVKIQIEHELDSEPL